MFQRLPTGESELSLKVSVEWRVGWIGEVWKGQGFSSSDVDAKDNIISNSQELVWLVSVPGQILGE